MDLLLLFRKWKFKLDAALCYGLKLSIQDTAILWIKLIESIKYNLFKSKETRQETFGIQTFKLAEFDVKT